MRGDGSVAGEGRVVGATKFHSSGLCSIIRGSLNLHLGVN